jgi:hypothetical protein
MRNEIDSLIAQGEDPTTAHQSVHGDIDPGDIDSKSKLAATLGRLQDDGINTGIKIEKDKGSILSRDAEYEKNQDQVTPDDLRTPMNQQVPDDQQTPQDQVAEELDYSLMSERALTTGLWTGQSECSLILYTKMVLTLILSWATTTSFISSL